MFKRKFAGLLALVLILSGLFAGSAAALAVAAPISAALEIADTAVRLQDDFYDYVNADWLASTALSEEVPVMNAFESLQTKVLDLLMADFETMRAEDVFPEMKNALLYYHLAMDTGRRNAEGMEPIRSDLDRIDALQSLQDLNAALAEMTLDGFVLPIVWSVGMNMDNPERNVLYADMPLPLYPAAGQSDEENTADEISQAYRDLLVLAGKSEEEAAVMEKQALAFDEMLAAYAYTDENTDENIDESTDDTEDMDPPMRFDAFSAYSGHLDFDMLLRELTGASPEEVMVMNPDYFEALDALISPENLIGIKSWMYLGLLSGASLYLSQEATELVSPELSDEDQREIAFYLALERFSPVISVYYGKTYSGEKAKQDVIQMTEDIIGTYADRLDKTEWLSDDTWRYAIRKLENLNVQIGYPDSIPQLYEEAVIDPEKSLYENTKTVNRFFEKNIFNTLHSPADQAEWIAPSYIVNAFYNPLTNTIMIPAAIMQAPFYSENQTASQNYGGLGATIGHEIGHAFDPSGSKYDETGKKADWWAKPDYEAYAERVSRMRDLFDGIEVSGGKVSGEKTLDENVADFDGLSVSLQALKSKTEFNLQAFFISYATAWREASMPEHEKELLEFDEHAPNKLRANIQVSQFQEFHDAFGVAAGDGMYVAPEARFSLW